MIERHEEIKWQMLEDNDLLETVRAFEASADRVTCFDRHVLHSDREVFAGLNIPIRELGIVLGLDLLRAWTSASDEVEPVLISRPYLIIDGEWILGAKNAAPPSVRICLAKAQELLNSGSFENAEPKKIDFEMDLDFSGMEFRYSDNEYGEFTWLVRLASAGN